MLTFTRCTYKDIASGQGRGAVGIQLPVTASRWHSRVTPSCADGRLGKSRRSMYCNPVLGGCEDQQAGDALKAELPQA